MKRIKYKERKKKSARELLSLGGILAIIAVFFLSCAAPGPTSVQIKPEYESGVTEPDLTLVETQPEGSPVYMKGISPLKPQPHWKTIKPGLKVIYFYDYFYRHLRFLPQDEPALQKGKSGKPIPALNHQFGREEVFDSGTNRGIGMRMTGLIHLPEPGDYNFLALSNDGIRIYINGEMIINDPDQHSDQLSNEALLETVKPGWYAIKVEYFQRKGTAAIALYWRKPGKKEYAPVPAKAYAHIFSE